MRDETAGLRAPPSFFSSRATHSDPDLPPGGGGAGHVQASEIVSSVPNFIPIRDGQPSSRAGFLFYPGILMRTRGIVGLFVLVLVGTAPFADAIGDPVGQATCAQRATVDLVLGLSAH
jgi:hypothetical protein